MSENERRLLEILQEQSFKRGQFRLASGDESTYYIDGKLTQVSPEGAYLIGEVIREQTADIAFDAIGGLEAGAIPLTTSAVISYFHHSRPIEGFWVRDKEKAHGTKKLVEGRLRKNSRVVILDDVVTRGSSALKAVQAVREIGCEVVRVLALVDRLQGAAKLYREHQIADYRTIFTIRDSVNISLEHMDMVLILAKDINFLGSFIKLL